MNKLMKLKVKKIRLLSGCYLSQVSGGTGGGGDSIIPTQARAAHNQNLVFKDKRK